MTGLCKLAGLDEVSEQDWSLNPGRYVGVVIEEDGKMEEEFISDLVDLNDRLISLKQTSREAEKLIFANIELLTRD